MIEMIQLFRFKIVRVLVAFLFRLVIDCGQMIVRASNKAAARLPLDRLCVTPWIPDLSWRVVRTPISDGVAGQFGRMAGGARKTVAA